MPATSPVLDWTQHPPFDRIGTEDLAPAVEAALADAREAVAAIEAAEPLTWEGLAEALERAIDPVERSYGLVGHLMGVANSQELREVQEALQPEVVAFRTELGQSEPLYRGWCALRDRADELALDAAQRRIVERAIRQAEEGGVALRGDERERFNAIQQELARLQTDFTNHVLDATKAWSETITDPAGMAGLPASARAVLADNARRAGDDQATAEAGPWRVTLDQPSFLPVMQHAQDRALRERAYRAFVTRAAAGEWDNAPLIETILALRREKAGLLGFGSFAEQSLSRKMAGSVAAAERLLEQLFTASRPAAERELGDLREAARAAGAPEADDFRQWDVAFWAERERERRYQLNDGELRPYFALPRVLDGLFALCERLFGIRIEAADGEVPVWHDDVRFFRVSDADGTPLAACYLDPYARPGEKRPGAWMNDCVGASSVCVPEGGERRLPVAYLVCNQAPPVDGRPSLMSFREVETLFHEFGHGLQHMLTTVPHADAAGIAGIEWDAVELPSQFMENWCYHTPTLTGLARHHESGEPLPAELVARIQAARTYRAGSNMLRQLRFGMTDLELHHRYRGDGPEADAFAVEARVAERCSVLPPLAEDRFLCAFLHIFAGGYAAGYYSYKWAEVLSADAFAAFEEAGLDDEEAVRSLGRRFRETVLALGGSRHPMEVFTAFRGREPDSRALLRHCGLDG